MVTFKYQDKFYTAYSANEVGNPHPKKYPCLLYLGNETIPTGEQRKVIKGILQQKGLDYHELISYAEKDINTHDLVTALIKFHDLKRM